MKRTDCDLCGGSFGEGTQPKDMPRTITLGMSAQDTVYEHSTASLDICNECQDLTSVHSALTIKSILVSMLKDSIKTGS